MKKAKTNNEIPNVFRPFLWSYDCDSLNLKKNKKIIILNLLNLGTKEATDLMKKIYSGKEIKEVIKNSYASEWDKKSLNFWKLIYETTPKKQRRID